jgi:hypothetical protein
MNEILNGEKIASEVLGYSGGAYVKRYFKIDTFKFPWISLFLRDVILRDRIQSCRQRIQEVTKLPIHKDELRTRFQSALNSIKNDRLSWFAAWLNKIQKREAFGLTSDNIRANQYIPPLDLSDADIDAIFSQLDEEGVRQADVDAMVKQCQKDIAEAEKVIARDLCPHDRWIYEDNGKPMPYPQGCRWTQYVNAWKKVAARFGEPVSVEGSAITNESEMSAYIALGLDKIGRITPLKTPYRQE